MSKTKPAGSKDVAPMIRGAFKRAVMQLEQGGRPLSTLMVESLQENFRDTLRAVSSFTPKELEITNMPTDIKDMNAEQLEQLTSLALACIGDAGDSEQGSSTEQPDSLH